MLVLFIFSVDSRSPTQAQNEYFKDEDIDQKYQSPALNIEIIDNKAGNKSKGPTQIRLCQPAQYPDFGFVNLHDLFQQCFQFLPTCYLSVQLSPFINIDIPISFRSTPMAKYVLKFFALSVFGPFCIPVKNKYPPQTAMKIPIPDSHPIIVYPY